MSVKAAAERAVRAVDWEALGKLVKSDDGRRELVALRRAFDETKNSLDALLKKPAKGGKIDWASYKEKVAPGIVDQFQRAYESVKIPEFKDEILPAFEQEHAALVKEAGAQAEYHKQKALECEEQLKQLKEEADNLRNITVDEYFQKHPDAQKKIDAEIAQGIWG